MDKKLEALRKEYSDEIERKIEAIKLEGNGVFELAEYIAKITGVPLCDYLLPCRKHCFVLPRQILSAVLYNSGIGYSFEYIGNLIRVGTCDHTTVIHNVKTIQDLIDTNNTDAYFYFLGLEYYKNTHAPNHKAQKDFERIMKEKNPIKYVMNKLKKIESLTNVRCKIEIYSDESGAIIQSDNLLFEFNGLNDLIYELDKAAPINKPLKFICA